jgi:uncharacterized protein YqjF (DUF2071 family)
MREVVPASLSLDLWDGKALVGIVPFKMRRIVPGFVPTIFGLNFLETNLRTYVHLDGRDPGVYFFSLEASSRLAVRIARRFFGLPYHDATMHTERDGDVRLYRSDRIGADASLRARWRVNESLGVSKPDSIEFFLLERYLLYVEREGDLHVGHVHHRPYPAHRAELFQFDETLTRSAGLASRADEPSYVHYSPGVDVEVFSTRPVAR